MFCNTFLGNFSVFWKYGDEQCNIFGVSSICLEALEVDSRVLGLKNIIKGSGNSREYVVAKYENLSNLEPPKNGKLCVGAKLDVKIRV